MRPGMWQKPAMTDETLPLDWTLSVEAVPERGCPVLAIATDGERALVAKALSLASLAELKFTGRVDRLAGGRYRLAGRVAATLEQPCVVTLDPVPARIDEPLDVEFRPDAMATVLTEIEIELDEASEVEPIVKGRLETGRVVYETLSSGLDPYPRKPGSSFDEMLAAPKGADTAKENPFAVLAKLKPKD
jgi:uncharacterized metal-binding protein YceD (DUF177 family)